MVITTTKTIVRNVLTASMATEVSSRELAFMAAYGEPVIDVGGVIEYGTDASISLPSRLVYIRTGFPVEQAFDSNTDPEATAKLSGWISTIVERLTLAKTTLMSKPTPNTPMVIVNEV
jgi:hypothetical protein